jgi:hypothetical protein
MPAWLSNADVLAHSSPGRKRIVLAGDFCFLKRRGGRVNFMSWRWDKSFCDLKISAASALWDSS